MWWVGGGGRWAMFSTAVCPVMFPFFWGVGEVAWKEQATRTPSLHPTGGKHGRRNKKHPRQSIRWRADVDDRSFLYGITHVYIGRRDPFPLSGAYRFMLGLLGFLSREIHRTNIQIHLQYNPIVRTYR